MRTSDKVKLHTAPLVTATKHAGQVHLDDAFSPAKQQALFLALLSVVMRDTRGHGITGRVHLTAQDGV